jgi:hypothetical protein
VSDTSDFDLSAVPDWARNVLERSPQVKSSQSVLDYREAAAWPLLVEAAVVNTFLPQDLAPDAVQSNQRAEAEKVLLNFAETARTSEGGLKWSLSNATRAEVIKAALHSESLRLAIDRTSTTFHDPGSEALRYCLQENRSPYLSPDLGNLEATRIALSSLRDVLPDLPGAASLNINTLNREIDRRRLLRVFERMIGRRPNPDGTQTIERFFGRDEEMEVLRGYVGVIPADSLRGRLRRGISWLSQTIKGRAPLVIWGVGGVGKTTLISKFMLEHAEAAVGRYPFAYLDFDRNMISARRLSGLLMEMCQQVGAQFDKLTQPMANLSARIAVVARSFDLSRDSESSSYVSTHAQEFRKLIDEFLEGEEATFEFARPFLLVFDTFEVAQYAADDIANLQDFVASFSKSNENRLWNRLRLIISGRKPVDVFLDKVEARELGALDQSGSVAMLIALASDAGKVVSEQDALALVKAIAKLTEEPTGGVQPLRLKLIGNLFQKDEEGGGSAIVSSLLKEFEKPLESGGLAASILIDGILVRRVLGHIRDPRVRALADPGLVVRRITPAVIKEVMTRATTDPAQEEPEGSDGDPSPPWEIDDLEAQRIFDEFVKEGTLVEKDDNFPDADPETMALRHRADVRRQMLPLIRARRPNRFHLVHQLAFDYFSKEVDKNRREQKNEMPAAAEAIYHGLYLDKPLEEVDALWPEATGFDPRIDAEEFSADSGANVYLRAKSSAKLQVDEVCQLPKSIALSWLSRRSSDLLDERRIDRALSAIRSVAGDDYSAIGDDVSTAAVLCRLLYRAGRWDDAYRLALRYLQQIGDDELIPLIAQVDPRGMDLLSLFRTALTIEAKSQLPGALLERVFHVATATQDPLAAIEICSHDILASAGTPDHQNEVWSLSPLIVQRCQSVLLPTWKAEQRILRLAAITTQSADLLGQWVSLRDRVARDVGSGPVIEIFAKLEDYKLLEELQHSLHVDPGNSSWSLIDAGWRDEKSKILNLLHKGQLVAECWRIMVFEHSDWLRPLGNALTRILDSSESDKLLTLLSGTEFGNATWRTRTFRERDGIGIVQFAADEGRLLELAQVLVMGRERFTAQGAYANRSSYPQTAFDIASALLGWHRLLEGYPLPTNNSQKAK